MVNHRITGSLGEFNKTKIYSLMEVRHKFSSATSEDGEAVFIYM